MEIDNASPTINKELLENWAISEKELEKIIVLARDIIDSKTTLLLAKASRRTALFDNELTVFQNAQVSDSLTDMDKWLALVVGNLLHDDVPKDRNFFNGRLEYPENLFEMIRGWNYYQKRASPYWVAEYFKGVTITNYSVEMLDSTLVNFSYSTFSNISIYFCNLFAVDFSYFLMFYFNL